MTRRGAPSTPYRQNGAEPSSSSESMNWGSVQKLKRSTLDCSRGVAASGAQLLRRAQRQGFQTLMPAFGARLGLEGSAQVLLLPVLLKERVAALLLAVSGSGEDMAGLEVLVQVAQLALDLQSYRRGAPPAAPPAPHPVAAVPSHAAPAAGCGCDACRRGAFGAGLRGARIGCCLVCAAACRCAGCR